MTLEEKTLRRIHKLGPVKKIIVNFINSDKHTQAIEWHGIYKSARTCYCSLWTLIHYHGFQNFVTVRQHGDEVYLKKTI